MNKGNSRRNKLEWVMNMLRKYYAEHPDGMVSKDALLAQFAVQNNSTERTGKEILNILEKTEMLKVKGNEITLRK